MRGSWMFLVALSIASAGCMRSDTEGLARIGRKLAGRSQAMVGGVRQRLEGNWKKWTAPGESPQTPGNEEKKVPGTIETPETSGNSEVVERVRKRLRWDKNLAGVDLAVELEGEDLVLKGKVESHEQRERAVSLAETTLGVTRVLVMLDMPKVPEEKTDPPGEKDPSESDGLEP